MMDKILSEIYNTLCYFFSCNKEQIEKISIIKEILQIKFKEITRQKSDCFYTDELGYFLRDTKSYNPEIAELLKNIFIKKEPVNSEIDIKSISTISASKSKSSKLSYQSIYLFGAEQVKNNSEYKSWTFEQLIGYVLKRHNNILSLYYYTWLDKYEWINHDASHRLGLAIYRAFENNINYSIKVSIHQIILNKEKIEFLLNNYELFIINKYTLYKITNIIDRKNYFTCQLRDENELIGFKKNEFKHHEIIRLLKQIDEKYILNFNNHIKRLLENQEKELNGN